jgi:hypothetical protein
MATEWNLDQSLEILIDELLGDDELREAFFRNPDRTLSLAADWGMPLSETELRLLRAPRHRLWERVAEELAARLDAGRRAA